MCQILKAIVKELSEILEYGSYQRGPHQSFSFEEGISHIFIEKEICLPNLVSLKLLVFSFIGGPFSVTAAAAAVFKKKKEKNYI